MTLTSNSVLVRDSYREYLKHIQRGSRCHGHQGAIPSLRPPSLPQDRLLMAVQDRKLVLNLTLYECYFRYSISPRHLPSLSPPVILPTLSPFSFNSFSLAVEVEEAMKRTDTPTHQLDESPVDTPTPTPEDETQALLSSNRDVGMSDHSIDNTSVIFDKVSGRFYCCHGNNISRRCKGVCFQLLHLFIFLGTRQCSLFHSWFTLEKLWFILAATQLLQEYSKY